MVSSLSSTTILPQLSTRCWSVVKGGPANNHTHPSLIFHKFVSQIKKSKKKQRKQFWCSVGKGAMTNFHDWNTPVLSYSFELDQRVFGTQISPKIKIKMGYQKTPCLAQPLQTGTGGCNSTCLAQPLQTGTGGCNSSGAASECLAGELSAHSQRR